MMVVGGGVVSRRARFNGVSLYNKYIYTTSVTPCSEKNRFPDVWLSTGVVT